MMAYSEDHIALAAEYALGTLDADERAQVEAMMTVDPNFAAVVEAWERKLGVLTEMVGLVEPSPEVWDKIRAAIGLSGEQQGFVVPAVATATVSDDDAADAERARFDSSAVERSNVIVLSRQARRWRGVATAMTAIAAVLVAMVAVQAYRPELLPEGLRPKATQQVAQNQNAAAQAQYVALLQTDATSPAFILSVDPATKNFTVRKVGAAAQEPGKAYELWIVSDKFPRPQSLGLIGNTDFTTRALSAYDRDTVSAATYAVSIEPEGGAPNGITSGPIVYTGKLIETVPGATR
jgi:anti-sigma-K factor RskA